MVLVACGKSLKLPKPKGKAVTLTQEQYDEKLKTLKVIDTGFAELESLYLYDDSGWESIISNKNIFEMGGKYREWIELENRFKNNEGSINTKINFFSDDGVDYLDFKFENKNNINTYFDINIENGKYYFNNTSNDLLGYYIMYNYGVEGINWDLTTESLPVYLPKSPESNNDTEILFYENKQYFTIHIKNEHKSLNSEQDQEHKIFYEEIYIFKDNYLYQHGVITQEKHFINGKINFESNSTRIVTYGVKEPKAGNYSKYQKIESLDDIFIK